MKKVVDQNGNLVTGLLRDETGALVVTDTAGLNKYKMQKQLFQEQQMKINSLQQDVSVLKQLVERIIQERQ